MLIVVQLINVYRRQLIKDIRDLFKPKKENKEINDWIISDIKNRFELEGNYYKPVKVGI